MAGHRTHSEVLSAYLQRIAARDRPIIIEVGIGLTSAILAQKARTLGARYYACDSNADLVDAMRGSISDDGFVEFRVGDSPMTLSAIAREVDYVDFAISRRCRVRDEILSGVCSP